MRPLRHLSPLRLLIVTIIAAKISIFLELKDTFLVVKGGKGVKEVKDYSAGWGASFTPTSNLLLTLMLLSFNSSIV
jgi:hypothetical protein